MICLRSSRIVRLDLFGGAFVQTLILLIFFLTYSLQAFAKWEDPCEMFLQSTELSIGVLGQGYDQQLYLGISSYVSSNHSRIVDSLVEDRKVDRILWMGELRHYRDGDGRPVITEANETSGFYYEIKNGKVPDGIRSTANHINDLPMSLRAPTFKGWTFDEENQHLLSELNSLKNIRHDVNTSLQLISTSLSVFRRTVDERKARQLLFRFSGARHRDIRLVRWLMNHMVQASEVKIEEFSELERSLQYLESGDMDGVSRRLDEWKVREQVWLLSSLMTKTYEAAQVEIFDIEN